MNPSQVSSLSLGYVWETVNDIMKLGLSTETTKKSYLCLHDVTTNKGLVLIIMPLFVSNMCFYVMKT